MTVGLILVWLIASHRTHIGATTSFLVAGGALLALGLRGNRFKLVIPGGILLGLGLGRVLAVATDTTAPELHTAARLLGLAGGFGPVYVLSRVPRLARGDATWAAITAVAIAGVALANAALGFVALTWRLLWMLGAWWPLLLVAVGSTLVISRLFGDKARYSV